MIFFERPAELTRVRLLDNSMTGGGAEVNVVMVSRLKNADVDIPGNDWSRSKFVGPALAEGATRW